MAEQPQIRFDDGAGYEKMMGVWSRIVGESFLDWLAPRPGLDWIDVGCGTGAFTELIAERSQPARILGIDPSEGQLQFARSRPAAAKAVFQQGDAMALPADARSCGVAVMALVIFFVPDPAKGVAELARVLRPAGTAAAYAWDILGGGFPMEPVQAEMRAMGLTPMLPPRPEASRLAALTELWTAAGFENIEVTQFHPTREFASFDEFWSVGVLSNAVKTALPTLQPEQRDELKRRVRARLPTDGSGRIAYTARANAVKGTLPRP